MTDTKQGMDTMSNAQIEEIRARLIDLRAQVWEYDTSYKPDRMRHNTVDQLDEIIKDIATLTPKPCTGESGKPPCSVWKSLSVHGNCRDCGHPKEAHDRAKPCTASPHL